MSNGTRLIGTLFDRLTGFDKLEIKRRLLALKQREVEVLEKLAHEKVPLR